MTLICTEVGLVLFAFVTSPFRVCQPFLLVRHFLIRHFK